MGQDLKWGHGGVIKETSRELGAGKSGESGLFSMYVLGLSYIGEGAEDRARRALHTWQVTEASGRLYHGQPALSHGVPLSCDRGRMELGQEFLALRQRECKGEGGFVLTWA